MSYEFAYGSVFRNKETRGARRHPWVIVSDPEMDAENVLVVNLTDMNHHHDHSCILREEDNPENIEKPSCVAYQFANVTSIARLVNIEKSLDRKAYLDEACMEKILAGAADSDELKNSHRELLRRQRLID
jgi:predicted class III extradiol MEMO1 family dioxygenase